MLNRSRLPACQPRSLVTTDSHYAKLNQKRRDNDNKADTADKDQAGNKEAAAARKILHEAGINVLRVSLPAEAGDLDEYFNAQRHTREDFDALKKEFASVTEARILGSIAKKDYYNTALTFLTLKKDFFDLYIVTGKDRKSVV